MRLQPVAAGLVAVTVGTSSTIVLLLQASQSTGIGERGFESWVFATTLGSGIAGLTLSLRHRRPILIAWSTPGAVLLVGSPAGYDDPAAVGAFVVLARLKVRSPVIGAFGAGLLVVALAGDLRAGAVEVDLVSPVLTRPRFELDAILAVLGVGAAFWGLVAGPLAAAALRQRAPSTS